MSWNYRLLRTRQALRDGGEEIRIAIHEVYYDKRGRPNGYTENPSWPQGETEEEFSRDFLHYRTAQEQPILDEKDFPAATQSRG